MYAAFLLGWSTPSRSVDRADIMLSELSARRPTCRGRPSEDRHISAGYLAASLRIGGLFPLSRVRIAQTHNRLRGQFRRFFWKTAIGSLLPACTSPPGRSAYAINSFSSAARRKLAQNTSAAFSSSGRVGYEGAMRMLLSLGSTP